MRIGGENLIIATGHYLAEQDHFTWRRRRSLDVKVS